MAESGFNPRQCGPKACPQRHCDTQALWQTIDVASHVSMVILNCSQIVPGRLNSLRVPEEVLHTQHNCYSI